MCLTGEGKILGFEAVSLPVLARHGELELLSNW